MKKKEKQYLLDANILIDMLKGNPQVQERIFREGFRNCFISEITIVELVSGVFKNSCSLELQGDIGFVRKHFRTLSVLPYIGQYAKLQVSLRQKGVSCDDNDVWLAAIAQTEELVLVTCVPKRFEHIDGLVIEDWNSYVK